MPLLMVALMGPGTGPKVPLHGRAAILRVSGIGDGIVTAMVDNTTLAETNKNGNVSLVPGDHVEVSYFGKARTLIAEIIRED